LTEGIALGVVTRAAIPIIVTAADMAAIGAHGGKFKEDSIAADGRNAANKILATKCLFVWKIQYSTRIVAVHTQASYAAKQTGRQHHTVTEPAALISDAARTEAMVGERMA
jgi:hypothetical protein